MGTADGAWHGRWGAPLANHGRGFYGTNLKVFVDNWFLHLSASKENSIDVCELSCPGLDLSAESTDDGAQQNLNQSRSN